MCRNVRERTHVPGIHINCSGFKRCSKKNVINCIKRRSSSKCAAIQKGCRSLSHLSFIQEPDKPRHLLTWHCCSTSTSNSLQETNLWITRTLQQAEMRWAKTEEKHPVFSFFIAVKHCNINCITSILHILLAHHQNVHPQQVHTECKKEK